MYQKLQLVLLIGAAFTAVACASTFSFDQTTRQFTRAITQCNTTGFQCDGCTISSECIEAAAGVFVVNNNPCDPGTSCNSGDGICTKEPNAECDENMKFELTCNQPGLFPHPFDRCQYLSCQGSIKDDKLVVEPKAVPLKCAEGYAFDSYTSLCKVKLPSKVCPRLIDPCVNSSQRASIPGNPSMYYICLRNAKSVLLPQLYVCPRDQVYNDAKRACQDVGSITGLDAAGKCLTRAYYATSNCMQYNECGGTGYVPILRSCPSKMRFNDKTQTCVDFTCAQLDPTKL